jgi:alpha-ketoglutarate-dependent taurine dioxygenase
MKIEPVDATLGARITDVRLAELTDDEWKTIADAFLEFAVLAFPDQHLSGPDQETFAARFGVLDRFAGDEMLKIGNVKPDGELYAQDDAWMRSLKGNEGWHTDSSYQSVSAKASMLTAKIVPKDGGQTEWTDMRAAYDALSDEMKAKIAPLAAYHSLEYSQAKIGYTGETFGYAKREAADPPLRPLVKIHPETKRPALFVGRHAYGIVGLPEAESDALIEELNTFATQPPRVYTHTWTVGELVVWDNRCVLHRVRPWPSDQARLLVHSRVAGDPATESALDVESAVG